MRATPKDALFSLLSTLLVTTSVFIPKPIQTINEASNVPLGLPLSFVGQNLSQPFSRSQGNPPSATPQPVSLGLQTPDTHPFTTFTGWCYLLNIAILFGSFRILDLLCLSLLPKRHRSPSQPSPSQPSPPQAFPPQLFPPQTSPPQQSQAKLSQSKRSQPHEP